MIFIKNNKKIKNNLKNIIHSYKTIIYISFLINIILLVFTYNVITNNKIYSFSGEDDFVKVSEGMIVINNDINLINGNNIKYINSGDYDIKSYKIGYYLMDDNKLIEIVSTSEELATPIKLSDIIDNFTPLNVVEKNSSNIYFTNYKKRLIDKGLYLVIEAKTETDENIFNKIKLNITKISKY